MNAALYNPKRGQHLGNSSTDNSCTRLMSSWIVSSCHMAISRERWPVSPAMDLGRTEFPHSLGVGVKYTTASSPDSQEWKQSMRAVVIAYSTLQCTCQSALSCVVLVNRETACLAAHSHCIEHHCWPLLCGGCCSCLWQATCASPHCCSIACCWLASSSSRR